MSASKSHTVLSSSSSRPEHARWTLTLIPYDLHYAAHLKGLLLFSRACVILSSHGELNSLLHIPCEILELASYPTITVINYCINYCRIFNAKAAMLSFREVLLNEN